MATDPNTVTAYNAGAADYAKHVNDPSDSIFHAYYEKPAIRAELPSLGGLEVLSIGCGSGVDARWLADNGAKRVVGVDISSGLIDIAKKDHPTIEFQEMDMEKLDFPDDSFDLAYSSLAIHYVDNWTPALKEARRVLRDGGSYIFSCGHPIDDSMEFRVEDGIKYAQLGRKIIQETGERTVYGDYLAVAGDGTKELTMQLAGIDITFFHRTFGNMLEQILASGFTIEKMVEPQPTEGMKAINPGMYEQLTRIPTFMIWVLRK